MTHDIFNAACKSCENIRINNSRGYYFCAQVVMERRMPLDHIIKYDVFTASELAYVPDFEPPVECPYKLEILMVSEND